VCRVIRADDAVPAVVRSKALAVGAGRWLRDLPDLVEMLAAADHAAGA
jgi:hypothetical protein